MATVVAYLLSHFFTPNYSLLRKIERLQPQKDKLHEGTRALSHFRDVKKEEGRNEELSRGRAMCSNDAGAQSEANECEVIHVAMVVSGSFTIGRSLVVVKSILFYRHNPLHFHLLTDPVSKEILFTIFKTWLLPAVNVTFYTLSDSIQMVKWIPNSHYSGVFGLVKLTLVTILPSSLDAVIFLDADVMLAADISKLWTFIRHLRDKEKELGLVENQSDWYLEKKHKPWPAVGRGFNTGVILLNLELMRLRNWNQTWHSTARESLVVQSRATLADQDIINAMIKKDKDIVYILPCTWNVQLSINSLSHNCHNSIHHFKIVHWNSEDKLEVKNSHAHYFKNLFSMFDSYDSNLFRTYLTDCKINSTSLPDKRKNDPCSDFRQEIEQVYRVHPFYLDYSYNSNADNDVTLVTQMSMDRLHMLDLISRNWDGPISITLYASDSDMREVLSYISASPVLKDSKKLALHVVSKKGQFYPINHLRNIAIDYVKTPYMYLSDIDFRPMNGLYHYIKKSIQVIGRKKQALIVPAFESLLYQINFPASKKELIKMLNNKQLFKFKEHTWKVGHSPTDYQHWKIADKPYKVNWAENFEPYVVVNRNVTRYDEKFVGYGLNKVSHIMELHAQGYEFMVLPQAFMIHMPHAPSTDSTHFRQSKHYRECIKVFEKEFKRELKKYKN